MVDAAVIAFHGWNFVDNVRNRDFRWPYPGIGKLPSDSIIDRGPPCHIRALTRRPAPGLYSGLPFYLAVGVNTLIIASVGFSCPGHSLNFGRLLSEECINET